MAASMPALNRPRIKTAQESPLAVSLPLMKQSKPILTSINELAASGADLYDHILHAEPSSPRLPPLDAGSGADGKMSNVTASLTLLKAMLGPLLLYAPHMFAEAGVLLATVMIVLAGLLSACGMYALVEVHDKVGGIDSHGRAEGSGKGAYADIGRQAVGAVGANLVEGCLVTSQWLYCVGYPIFVARNLQCVLSAAMSEPPSLRTLTLMQLPVLVPYCWVRDIRSLGYPMLAANVFLWGSLATVLFLVGTTLTQHAIDHSAPPVALARWGPGTLLFTAQAVVAFEGIALVLPIREAMREPQHFHTVMLSCMTAGTFTLTLTGAAAYLAYGSATATFVTLNIEGGAALCVRAAFSCAVILTYPLQLFPAMQALEERLGIAADTSSTPKGADDGWRVKLSSLFAQCAARSALVGAAFMFALYAPYDNLVGLAGGLCAVPLAFIFPAWFHLRLCAPAAGSRMHMLNLF